VRWQLDQSITRSQAIKIGQNTKVNSQSTKYTTREPQQGETTEAAPWEAYKEQDRYVETFGIGTSGISELRHKWLRSGRHHSAKSRPLFSNFVTTTPWRVTRVCPPNSPSARTPSYWSGDSAEDIGSDASRHLRQPCYHSRAELIGERRSVADVKH